MSYGNGEVMLDADLGRLLGSQLIGEAMLNRIRHEC
jgi:hypothetical protein